MAEAKVKNNTDKRKRLAGRQKGTPNKSTEYIFDLCQKHDFDPIEILIYVAQADWESLGYPNPTIEKMGFQGNLVEELVISTEHRMDATKTLVSYMYPKRKAIEVKNTDPQSSTITLNYNPLTLKESKDPNAK